MPIKHLTFPANNRYRYYKIHYQYVLDSLRAAGIEVEISDRLKQLDKTVFEVLIDGKHAAIDFNNFTELYEGYESFEWYFKFQYSEGLHEHLPNVYPMGTISFYDWQQYAAIKPTLNYTATSNKILNNQRPYAGALQRRRHVQKMLRDAYGPRLDISVTNKEVFWQKINDCLISICVPGARNDIFDRGQNQYMAFGCATISPKILTILPYYKPMVPGTHYIECAPDYSNLIEVIEWCHNHRSECVQIGKNAQELFEATQTPEALWRWADMVLNGTAANLREAKQSNYE